MIWKAPAVSVFLAVGLLLQAMPGARAAAPGENDRRWPRRTIPYAICDCSNGDPKPLCSKFQCLSKETVNTAQDAITGWNKMAEKVLKFTPRDPKNDTAPYVLFISQESSTSKDAFNNEDKCASYGDVGWSGTNDPKIILIPDGCLFAKDKTGKLIKRSAASVMGTMMHEMGHAVGLNHEQQRTDRDKYIVVKFTGNTANKQISQSGRMCASDNEENCEFQSRTFFRQYTHGRDVGEYDFGSVMHYPLNPGILKTPEETANLWKEVCTKADDLKTACIGLKKDGFERLKVQQLDINSIADRTRGLSSLDVEALDKYYQGIQF